MWGAFTGAFLWSYLETNDVSIRSRILCRLPILGFMLHRKLFVYEISSGERAMYHACPKYFCVTLVDELRDMPII
jgi:hypothetical protein